VAINHGQFSSVEKVPFFKEESLVVVLKMEESLAIKVANFCTTTHSSFTTAFFYHQFGH